MLLSRASARHYCKHGSPMPVCRQPAWSGPLRQRRGVVLRAQEDKDARPDSESNLEDMFTRELKRRGISSTDSLDGGDKATKAAPKDPFSSGSRAQQSASSSSSSSGNTSTRLGPPPPEAGGQRERSMAMVTEGLEGLPGRASLLIRLGGGFFLSFLPFMGVFSVIFTLVYFVFGTSFLHYGSVHERAPTYDVDALLSEPTVDPYVGFRG